MIKNEIQEVLSKKNKHEYRKFGITIGIVLSLISAFLFWKIKVSAPYFLGVGMGFLLFGLIIPNALRWITSKSPTNVSFCQHKLNFSVGLEEHWCILTGYV